MKKKEVHTYYNYQFKHTAVSVTQHPNIQASDVAEALNRWRGEMRVGKIQDNDAEARSITELMDAQKKIKQLEKELKRLRGENAVLKKAERLFPGKK